MITKYEELFQNKKNFDRLKNAIKKVDGRIVVLVHPFSSPDVEYTKQYKRNIRQIVQKSKFPVCILIGEGEPKKILEGRIAEGQQIVVVETHSGNPAPTYPKHLKQQNTLKFFSEMLANAGVQRVLLGGELGKFYRGAKKLYGICVPVIATAIKDHTKINVTVMPEMLWMEKLPMFKHGK